MRISGRFGQKEFVIIGSLSILGAGLQTIPERMVLSNDCDGYTPSDPEKAFEFVAEFGQSSAFAQEFGYYFDAVTPALPTLPDGWETRLNVVELKDDIRLKFIEPHDCALSKYARLEVRDVEWVRAGLAAGVLEIAVLKERFKTTSFLDRKETERAWAALVSDGIWLEDLRSGRAPSPPSIPSLKRNGNDS